MYPRLSSPATMIASVMAVTARAVVRGLARSASMRRRAATSSPTESAMAVSAAATPGPRRREARISEATTRSAVGSSRSSAKRRSADSVGVRAAIRADSVATSAAIGAGAVRAAVWIACSRPTPIARTSASRRVHSSTASTRRSGPRHAFAGSGHRRAARSRQRRRRRPRAGQPVNAHTATAIPSAAGQRMDAQDQSVPVGSRNARLRVATRLPRRSSARCPRRQRARRPRPGPVPRSWTPSSGPASPLVLS